MSSNLAMSCDVSREATQKIREELKVFSGHAKEWFDDADRSSTREFHQFFSSFFTEENLMKAEWEDIKMVGNHIHAMNQVALAKARAFGNPNYSIQKYRETFMRLAFGDGSVEDRVKIWAVVT